MKLIPPLLALALVGGPAVAQAKTPYQETVSGFAVATCWIANGVDTDKNVMRYLETNLGSSGIYKPQINRIVALPGFKEDVERVINTSGGCEKLIPQNAAPARNTYSL